MVDSQFGPVKLVGEMGQQTFRDGSVLGMNSSRQEVERIELYHARQTR